MKLEEFTDIFSHIESNDALRILQGDSPHAIDNMRTKSAVYYARVGMELARAKNYIRGQYLLLRAQKESVATSEKQAEANYDEERGKEVTYYELKYLYEALEKSMTACASGSRLVGMGGQYDKKMW